MAQPPLPGGPAPAGAARNMPPALLTAARDNEATIIIQLVKGGADVNGGNAIGQTATHIAALHGNLEALQALLSAGANASVQNERGATPLHFAVNAKKKAAECCQLLLSGGADPMIRDGYGRAPYEMTEDSAMRLMLGGPPMDLHEAARNGRLDDIKKHVEAGLGIDERDPSGATPLHVAVDEGKTEAALLLLQLGASAAIPDERGFSPLHLAIIREDPVVAQALIAAPGVDLSCKSLPPPRPEFDGPPPETTPLNIAVEMRQVDIVRALLAKGANASVPDGNGNNAAHIALETEQLPLLEALLQGGADPNAGNKEYHSPAHFCALKGKTEALKLYLAAKADPNLKEENGFTPLHLAARAGRAPAAEALLAAGADPNAANKSGATALHLAGVNKRAEVMAVILKHAAGKVDVNAKNANGETPLQVAKSDEVKELLKAAGAV